ncbi:MAG: hypothetical protein ACYTX0_50070 [Nostoc sp.]
MQLKFRLLSCLVDHWCLLPVGGSEHSLANPPAAATVPSVDFRP